MYTGQIAVITTQDDWVSDFYQITDDDTGAVINIANPSIGFDVSVTISDRQGSGFGRTAITLASGQIFIAQDDDGPGIQWVFPQSQLANLCSGTYECSVVVMANGLKTTLMDADLIVEAIR